MPEVNCQNCGKEVHKTPREYNKHKLHFCSRKCLHDYRVNSGDYLFKKRNPQPAWKTFVEQQKLRGRV